MTTVVHLLGPPTVERHGQALAGPRGRKAWGLFAFLLLADRAPSRQRLVSLLFERADDPRGALRWNLAEMRRAFAGLVSVGGDPVGLDLAEEVSVDVTDLARVDGEPAVPGGELLEGLSFDDSPTFETWVSAERARLASDCRAVLYRLAVESLATEDFPEAARIAARAVHVDPLNADAHAVLVAALARSGNPAGARDHVARCTDTFRRELGMDPPAEVAAAAVVTRERPARSPAAVRSLLEAGDAALSAGAVETGVARLRRAVVSVQAGDSVLAARARLALASALIHGRGARGAEVVTLLHEARADAVRSGLAPVAASACGELAFLSVLSGHRVEGEHWLREAEEWLPDRVERAGVLGLRGMSLSDAARYPAALEVLEESIEVANSAGHRRRVAWSRTMVGRVHLLRGDTAQAAVHLDLALADVREDRWTAFAPFPQALRAEAALAEGDTDLARDLLDQGWVLATEVADQCWISAVAHAQALLAEHERRDPTPWCRTGLGCAVWYVWLRARIVDLSARLAGETRAAADLADELARLATAGGMREYVVRALIHRSRLGEAGQLDRARALAVDIPNPMLTRAIDEAAS